MNFIAVIPARKNSKGIIFKNRYKINGETITRLAIKKAIKFKCKYVILTSDDEYLCRENRDIAHIIKRPKNLSGDNACSFEVWRHAVLNLINNYKLNYINFSSILLEPTSPNRKLIDLKRATNLHLINKCSVLTVSKLNKSYSPEKIMEIDKFNNIKFYKKDGLQYLRRQKIKDYYYRNGVCYCSYASEIIKKNPKKLFYNNCKSLIINRYTVNLDEKEDLKNLK